MQSKRTTPASAIALGGVLAAVAVVVMSIGTIFSIFVYICPVICMALTQVVDRFCGHRIAWAWYGAVALLSAIMAPDKEAAAVFLFLGYYPIIKPKLDGKKLGWIWKLLLFNGSIVVMTWLLSALLGIALVEEEFQNLRYILIAGLLAMGNFTFFVVDRMLVRTGNLLEKAAVPPNNGEPPVRR